MREPTSRGRAAQWLLAFLLLAPLAAAFWGGGGLDDAFAANQSAEAAAARRWMLLGETGRSIFVGALSTLVAALIGVPAGWALAGRRMSAFHTALMMLPFALPAPVAVSGWVQLIAPSATSSFTLQLPGAASFASALHGLLFSSLGAAFVLGLSLWPVIALHAWPGFRRARDESYDCARLSASPARAFFRTVLPRCKGHLAAGLALVFVLASSDFGVCSLLLVKTLPVEVHDQTALGRHAAAAWAALPLVLLALGFSALLLKMRGKEPAFASPPPNAAGTARASRFCSWIWVGGALLGFAVPMIACLRGVLSSGKPLSFAFDAGAESLLLSARLAAAAVLLGCAAGVARLVCWPDRRADALNFAGVLVLAVPGAFVAASLFTIQINAQHAAASGFGKLLNQPLAWLACGFALRFLYVPLRLTEEAAASIPPALLESAAVLGQNSFRRAVSVALPLSLGHLAAAAALIFTLTLGEVAIAATLAPPGAVPATIWLFNQQHMGYDESVFALSLLLGAVSAVAIGIGALGAKWAAR